MSENRRAAVILRHLASEGVEASPCSASRNSDSVGWRMHPGTKVAVVTIDNPPMNALSPPVALALHATYHELRNLPSRELEAIVVTGANGRFSAGADIKFIHDYHKTGKGFDGDYLRTVNNFFCTMEEGDLPIVAAIDDVALGGGMELAMACHGRVATTRCRLGLPELTLGIIPGFGGTQRLPRLVGVQSALQMMLTTRPLSAKAALDAGLVDRVVEPTALLEEAVREAQALARAGPTALRRSLQLTDCWEGPEGGLDIVTSAAEMVKPRAAQSPQAVACVDAVRAALERPGRQGRDGVAEEMRLFQEIAAGPVAQSLVHLFVSQRTAKHLAGVTDRHDLRAASVTRAAVIGGGLMGSGIATAMLLAGVKTVIISEINSDAAAAGVGRVKGNLQKRLDKGRLSAARFDAMVAGLAGQVGYSGFDTVDLVVEAAIEKLSVKQEIFSEIERVCGPHAVLATNTSTLDLNLVSQKMANPHRLIGLHFFSPAHVMPLVEIVRTRHTAPQPLLNMLDLTRRMNKTPVVAMSAVGFAVNRTFFPYGMAAGLLAMHGVDVYEIDRAIKSFGMPMGPFALSDLVGADVQVAVGGSFKAAFPGRIIEFGEDSLAGQLYKAKRLGQKTGAGYYIHKDGAAEEDDAVRQMQASAARAPRLQLTPNEIVEIVMFPVVNEACRVVEEGIVQRGSDVDVSSILGMGFPPHRGGILFWGSRVGADVVCASLESLQAKFNHPFFEPCQYLRSAARNRAPLS